MEGEKQQRVVMMVSMRDIQTIIRTCTLDRCLKLKRYFYLMTSPPCTWIWRRSGYNRFITLK